MRSFCLFDVDPDWDPIIDAVPQFDGFSVSGYDEYGYPIYVEDLDKETLDELFKEGLICDSLPESML